MSKKKNKPREKYRNIEFQTDEPIEVKRKMKFEFTMSDKFEVKAVDEDSNEYFLNPNEIEEYHIKNNGNKKILSTSVINKEQKVIDIDQNLLTYDCILAIDTSYDLIGDVKKAFTAIATIEKMKDSSLSKETMNILEWDATGIDKPENLMYAHGISSLNKFILDNKINVKVAVIVDSDFDNISSFNKHILPIFDNYMLPDNFFIFYASTDNGTCLANQLLRHCDAEAKSALKDYKK